MKQPSTVISILGSSGGVAKAILSVLEKSYGDIHDPIHSIIKHTKIHLIDLKQKEAAHYRMFMPKLFKHATLHQFDLNNLEQFRKHLRKTVTTHVIDVSWADTVDMLTCCQDAGVHYINTALENPKVDENESLAAYSLLERFRLFQEGCPQTTQSAAIIGSGMNPGVVQWMAIELMKESPDEIPIACYIVEHDSSLYKNPDLIKDRTIYSTWSPECFLEEAILNYPLFMKHRFPFTMHIPVFELEFKVTLGSKQFYGSLMPHEEVLTLGKAFDMETGFIYRVSDYTIGLIRSQLNEIDDVWEWDHHVLDPAFGEVGGEDLVGVLLVYPNHERYMYNVLRSDDIYPQYHINATYFQVACGIYGALCTLLKDGVANSVYFVDELLLQTESRYGEYLSYYMKDFVKGENSFTDGQLLDRMRRYTAHSCKPIVH
ncbi:saccharopine dehydrogenase NADP-binding domain-containing protein [Paenibacillus lautus]|uniref:S-adenosylmethionine decarboxylase related protein n=1 Tax=Paenibacillus lautus TaxID=1401 RepID=A0A385TM13_PAELA|nr:saccharopine dehydrogenase NADP-binding domain-containing protein [Paenibacillus lautus]AYB44759.1 S-adenosylmethionine decarboxylase related protein [Paenibacillus lautus]